MSQRIKVLWVTSCAPDMWDASARELLKSFVSSKSEGKFVLCHEGPMDESTVPGLGKNVLVERLDKDEFLNTWLATNADFIPAHLGGNAQEPLCKCPGGPFEPHSKQHKMPCLGHWFNKNASRWFRKIASLLMAVRLHVNPDWEDGPGKMAQLYDAVIWVDADCVFKRQVKENIVRGWFKHSGAFFYCKNRRPVLEAGVVGYHLKNGGGKILMAVVNGYNSGNYRNYDRWDDSYVIQKVAFKHQKEMKLVDLAYSVGEHAAVVQHSALGPFITHDKGRHGRRMGIMT
jgi:hypothetical protein